MFFNAVATRPKLCKFAYIGQAVLIHNLNSQNQLIPVSSMWPIGSLVTGLYSNHMNCAICRKTSTEKWQLVAKNRKLFCFIRMWNKEQNLLLSILASRDFAMSGKFSPLPAK